MNKYSILSWDTSQIDEGVVTYTKKLDVPVTAWVHMTDAEKAKCRAIWLEEEMSARNLESFYLWLPIPPGEVQDLIRDAYLTALSRGVELDRLAAAGTSE